MHKLTKDQFVAILDTIGLTDAQKHRFHAEMEKRHPEGHQGFLEWLGIPQKEIAVIRQRAQS